MYIAELAPAHIRGKMVSLNQLTVVIGILLAQLANWLIARPISYHATANDILYSWNGQVGWRWMFGVTVIPSLFFLIAMFFVPESPRWLAGKGKMRKAEDILTRIGGAAYGRSVSLEIEASLKKGHAETSLRSLFERRMLKVLGLGIFLAVLQQWRGINVIFNYAEEVFSAAGYQVSDILFNIVVTGAVNVVFTMIALRTVDRYGRRILMLFGTSGLAIIYSVLGLLYHRHSRGIHMLLLVVAAIACYAMSLAPVTWVVISEIFPGRIRSAAVSISVTSLWWACFVLTYTFPLLNSSPGAAGLGGPPTQVNGPGYKDFDFSLFKSFRVTESSHAEFRAEAFNLTNTPSFNLPSNLNYEGNNPAFGQITTTRNNARELQFAFKYYW